MASRKRTPSWLRSIYDKAAAQPLRALLDRRQSQPQTFQIAFEQDIYLINVRRHRRARRYTLRIHSSTREVILTMPPRGSLREAKAFAQKHGGWIAARLRRLPAAAPFADGATVPLRGVAHCVLHCPGRRGTVWTDQGESGEHLLCVAGDAPHVERRVGDFLRREAHRDLSAASRHAAQALGVAIKRISVRDQSSRWGSCSSTGVRLELSRRPRGRASGRDEPFAAVLAAGASRLPGRGARQGLARRARRGPASLWLAG